MPLIPLACAKQVLGYPKSNSVNKEDDEMLSLLGERHDAKAKAQGRSCPCNLCKFNDKLQNARGQCYRIMVADAKECSEGVSFFGVRRFLIVDIPSSASEYIQRVGRAIRFMGHAGLPKEERKVQIRLYQAALPHEDGGSSAQKQLRTRDEELVEQLQESVAAYQRKLRVLQQEAFDNGTWVEAAEDVMEDVDLDAQWDEELEEVVWDEEAPAPAPPPAPAPVPAPPPPVPTGPSITLATSTFKRLYNAEHEYTVDNIWKAVQAIVATCAGGGANGEMVAQRFVKRLKMTYITAGKQYADETDADRLAVLLWSATERSTDNREFCSYLNQCLRDDTDPPLRHAVVRACPCHRLPPPPLTPAVCSPQVFACQLNKSLVGNFGGRAKGAGLDKGTWPCGPDAEFGISTKANVTWRGTALPWKHLGFFTVGRQFRTNMFLATSFDRDVAERFMTMVRQARRLELPSASARPPAP